jgi:hypothetical protein
MCCSSASLACSDVTRASVEIRSSRLYSSFGEVPIVRCNAVTASQNADVAASYSIASRVFSSQPIAPTFACTQRTSQLVVKHALVGCIPRVQCPLFKLKPKLLRSPPLSSYWFVVNRELILSPDPKGKFVLLL